MSRIIIDEINIECFEKEFELNNYLRDNSNDNTLKENMIFYGKIYDFPHDKRKEFFKNPNDLIVDIKKQNYNDVQFVFIYK